MNGATFDDVHSFEDLGMYLTKKVIHEPEVQTNYVDVPQRDGKLDLTEGLTGQVKYGNRLIELTFTLVDNFNNYSSRFTQVANFLHGRQKKIIFDDDPDYFYIGRIKMTSTETEKNLGIVKMDIDCEPYKYDVIGTDEDWLWDPFDFEDGVINDLMDLTVNGIEEVTIIAKRQVTYPTISSDSTMKVEYGGLTYDVLAGENKMYDILLTEGENSLKFIGYGKITIRYRGGSL